MNLERIPKNFPLPFIAFISCISQFDELKKLTILKQSTNVAVENVHVSNTVNHRTLVGPSIFHSKLYPLTRGRHHYSSFIIILVSNPFNYQYDTYYNNFLSR